MDFDYYVMFTMRGNQWRKHTETLFFEKFQMILSIAIGQIIGCLYKFLEEWKTGDFVDSPNARILLSKSMKKTLL